MSIIILNYIIRFFKLPVMHFYLFPFFKFFVTVFSGPVVPMLSLRFGIKVPITATSLYKFEFKVVINAQKVYNRICTVFKRRYFWFI